MKKHIKKFVLLGMAGLMMSGSLFIVPDLAEMLQVEEDYSGASDAFMITNMETANVDMGERESSGGTV